jgi:hypothetical protein
MKPVKTLVFCESYGLYMSLRDLDEGHGFSRAAYIWADEGFSP